jgi:hypothetical protein
MVLGRGAQPEVDAPNTGLLTLGRVARPARTTKERVMTRKHNILTVLLLSAAPASASPPTPPPDAQLSREMLDLRADLVRTPRDKVQADVPKFRPLCDRDGYPLVGNLANKPNVYQPSQFCADVRKAEKRS